MNIKKQLDSDDHYKGRNNVQYIVLHDTGNFKDTAQNNADYFCSGSRQASAHYFVDETSIIQLVEDIDGAWHCGDGHGEYGITNNNSIGIEMCNSGGYIAEKTIQNTLELVKMLMKKYNVDDSHVVRHYDASRKICPMNMSANDWELWRKFKDRLKGSIGTTLNLLPTDYGTALVKADTKVYEKDSVNSKSIGSLSKGQTIRVCKICGNWADVYYPPHGGWVRVEPLELKKANKSDSQTKEQPKVKQEPQESQLFFRVICGSFKERANAEELQTKLKNSGFDSFLEAFRKE